MDDDPIQAEEGVCRIEYVISEESFPKLKEARKGGEAGTEYL